MVSLTQIYYIIFHVFLRKQLNNGITGEKASSFYQHKKKICHNIQQPNTMSIIKLIQGEFLIFFIFVENITSFQMKFFNKRNDIQFANNETKTVLKKLNKVNGGRRLKLS